MTNKENKIRTRHIHVKIKDLYQFLLAEVRYGMSRNNHLMPGAAFSHCKAYLKKIEKSDSNQDFITAQSIAKQIAEEICFEAPFLKFNIDISCKEPYLEVLQEYEDFLNWIDNFLLNTDNKYLNEFKERLKLNDSINNSKGDK